MDKPLVTFAIAAFNQEPFIQQAVEAAFAQEYSPLEIILSDDHSKDRTFDIMSAMAAAYRGPHRIILNRNDRQRCIGGHINRVVEISHGELIVGAAGDDISLPARAHRCLEAWEASGRKATSIHSDIIQIDENNREVAEVFGEKKAPGTPLFMPQSAEPLSYLRTLEPLVYGCAHTFSRQLFRAFGPLPESLIHEDNVLSLRSILRGRLVRINEPLVKYRIHGNNIFINRKEATVDMETIRLQEQRLLRNCRNREGMFDAFQVDVQKAIEEKFISAETGRTLLKEIAIRRRQWSLKREFYEGKTLSRVGTLVRLWKAGLTPKEKRQFSRRLLPDSLFVRLRWLRSSLQIAAGRRSPSVHP